jgi:hypothetical protein
MNTFIPKTKAASAASLAELEKLFGRNLPKSYLNFVAEHDGARPSANVFKVGENNHAGVDEFIPVHESLRIPHVVDGFPAHALAVARASGGNFVYLEPTNYSVYFWDHEVENADTKLANSFDEFLEQIQASDVGQVKLKPGQVKRVWGNPDFKPEF